MFKGLYTAIVTPFCEGKLDESAYRRLIEYVLNGGADGVVPNGTTGENPALNDDERRAIINIAVEMCHERGAKVIAGAGTNNTYRTIELVNDADKLGADAALVITPYYNKPTQRGLTLHFQTVQENTSLPIVMYNVPSRTGVNMRADTAVALAEEHNIVGLKEASGDLMQFAEVVKRTPANFTVLSGDDGLTLPSMAVGGSGVISVAGNVAPKMMKDMLEAYENGRIGEALEIHWKLLPLFQALFAETSPAPCKKALEIMGICRAEVRLPLAPVEDKTAELLQDALNAIGIGEAI